MAADAGTSSSLLDDLEARGLLFQTTDREALREHLSQPRAVYAGFDPTRDSLTIGNLVAILLLKRFQMAGHRPVVIMGGGTGLIGDPSGKDSERQLLDREGIERNVAGQRPIFDRVFGVGEASILNNAEWLEKLSFVDVLRDVGKHFSVNMMIQKDSVRTRLEEREHGISYTEFSYMILQAYDFAYLAEHHDVSVQLGGSDQWGNIVAGVDLARRGGRQVFGLTAPLVTKSDGGKFGKTESGAVWLTRSHTSPYAFYQFWLNASDADVANYLKVFSLRPVAEIESLLEGHAQHPAKREAQRVLAEELTELLHGPEGLADARAATQALFSGDVTGLSPALLDEAFAGAPGAELERGRFEGEGVGVVDLLVEAGAVKSKREARQFMKSGAISINGQRIEDERALTAADLLHGRVLLIRRGKKNWTVVRVA